MDFSVDPKTVRSRVSGGTHVALFFEGPYLFAEFDGFAVERVKAINKNDIVALYELLQGYQKDVEQFAKNYPVIAPMVTAAAKQLPKAILTQLGISTSQAVQIGVAFLLIEIAILIVRAVEINHKHMNSVNGGVIIEIVFPNPQIQSIVLPRGGAKGMPALEKAGTVGLAARQKVAGAVQSVQNRVGAWRA